MKRMLPNRVEISVLGAMAILFAVVFSTLRQETALPLFMFPLLLASMLMGARRTGKLGAPADSPSPSCKLTTDCKPLSDE